MKLDLPHFLFINGPSGSGKSTLAKMICEQNPSAYRESFAEPIREMIRSVFFPQFIVDFPYDLRDQTVKNLPLLQLARLLSQENPPERLGSGPSVRAAMIAFSEQYMKPLFGNDVFGRLCFARCVEQTAFYQHFVIDDSGFFEEAHHIISRVGADNCHLVRLHRPGCNFAGDSRGHIALPGVQTLDLHNNSSPSAMLDILAAELNGTLRQPPTTRVEPPLSSL